MAEYDEAQQAIEEDYLPRRRVDQSIGTNPVVPSAPADAEPLVDFNAAQKAAAPRRPIPPALSEGSDLSEQDSAALENYRQSSERFDAKRMLSAQRAQRKELNATSEATLRTDRVQQFVDATGAVQPVRDAAGNIQYRPGKGPVQYDESGRAVQTQYDTSGPKQVQLDKDAPIGTHPDRPGELYRQNKHSPWEYLGTVADGLQSKDKNIQDAAKDAQLGVDKVLHGAAGEVLGQNVYNTAEALKSGAAQIQTKSKTLTDLNARLEQLNADPRLNETEGGFLGIGSHPTSTALAMREQRDQLSQQIDSLAAEGITGNPKLDLGKLKDAKAAHAAATAERSAWGAVAPKTPGELDQILDERRTQLIANGQNPNDDPVISAVEKKRNELGLTPKPKPAADTQDPLMREHVALQAEHDQAAGAIEEARNGYEERLAPIAQEVQKAQAQMVPLQAQATAFTRRLESLVGASPGASADELSQRLGSLTDPETRARAQTIIDKLEPIRHELGLRQAEMQPLVDAHQKLALEANLRLEELWQAHESELAPKRDALTQKFNQRADEQSASFVNGLLRPPEHVYAPSGGHVFDKGEAAYHVNQETGRFDIDPNRLTTGLVQAKRDGYLNDDQFKQAWPGALALEKAALGSTVAKAQAARDKTAAGAQPLDYRRDGSSATGEDVATESLLRFYGGAVGFISQFERSPVAKYLDALTTPLTGASLYRDKAVQFLTKHAENVQKLYDPSLSREWHVHAAGFLGAIAPAMLSGPADIPLLAGQGYQAGVEHAQQFTNDQGKQIRAGIIGGIINSALAIVFRSAKTNVGAPATGATSKLVEDGIDQAWKTGRAAGVIRFLDELKDFKDVAGQPLNAAALGKIRPALEKIRGELQTAPLTALKNIGGTMLRDSAIGAGVTVAQNVAARDYNPDQDIWEGAFPSAVEFGAFGGLAATVGAARTLRSARRDTAAFEQFAKSTVPSRFGQARHGLSAGGQGVSTPGPITPDDVSAAYEGIGGLSIPNATPEQHAATQDALSGLVKIAGGKSIDSLSATERAAIESDTPDGIDRVQMVKGKPVITQGTLDRVADIAPAVRKILPESEEAQRQGILNPVDKTTPESGSVEATSSQPNQKTGDVSQPTAESSQNVPRGTNEPTFSVEVQNPRGETTSVEVQAADETAAHAQVAAKIPAGQGLIRSVTQISQPDADQQKSLADHAVEQIRERMGGELSPTEEKNIRNIAGVLDPHYQRWQRAFNSVQVSLLPNQSGGAAVQPGNHLLVSIPDIIRHREHFTGSKEHAANVMAEEAIHSVSTALEDRDPNTGEARGPVDLVKIFKALPAKLQTAMKGAYKIKDATDYQYAHEFWRMFMQGQLELARGGKIKLKGKFLQEQSSRQFVVENRKVLATLMRYFRNMEGELRRQKTGEDVISEVNRATGLLRAKIKEVDEHAHGASEVQRHEADAGKIDSGNKLAPTRGPPEPAGSEGAAPSSGSSGRVGSDGGGNRAPAENVGGAVEPDSRRELAQRLNVPETAVGHSSKVTQNARTLNVAYVAQEAGQARPSHDVQGRSTPGYDQALQPRDRSLPAYRKQSQNIANDLRFEQSAFFPGTQSPATTADVGAPIMTPTGDTLVGNGREIGIRAAYDSDSPAARRYKQAFVQHAAKFGIDPQTVMRMRQPILKRVILGDVPKDQLVRFSQESNQATAMASNAIELASQDATRITPELLSLFDPNYAIDATQNRDFIRAYLQTVTGQAGANEANFTPSDLVRRIRMGIFANAYGMDPTGRAAIERMAGDESDTGGRTITNALLTVSPLFARTKADIAQGALYPLDITPAIGRAAQLISEAIRNKPAKQSANDALENLRDQRELPGSEAGGIANAVMDFLIDNRTNRSGIEEGLSNYVESVFGLGDPREGQLFGDREVPRALELFKRAVNPESVVRRDAERASAATALKAALGSQPLVASSSAESTYAAAEQAKPEFDRMVGEIAASLGGRADIAPLKSRERAAAKVQIDYDGDWSRIKDVVRATIWVRDVPAAFRMVRELQKRFGAPKRNITDVFPTGYRDALFNPVINGHATELQINVESIAHAKTAAHKFYERQQEIARRAKAENRELSAQELRTVERLDLAQQRIYQAGLPPGISSTASEGLQPLAAATSASVAGRGLAEPSNSQGVPSRLTTSAKAPSGASGAGSSRNVLALGKSAVASSSVIPLPYTREGGIGKPVSAPDFIDVDSPLAGNLFPIGVGREPAFDLHTAEKLLGEGSPIYSVLPDGEEAVRVKNSDDLWKYDRSELYILRSQQTLDLFGDAAPAAADYARKLPAAAKSSRPALKRQLEKDGLGKLAGNDAALSDLFALAQPKASEMAAQAPEVKVPQEGYKYGIGQKVSFTGTGGVKKTGTITYLGTRGRYEVKFERNKSTQLDEDRLTPVGERPTVEPRTEVAGASKPEHSWELSNWVERQLHDNRAISSAALFRQADEAFGGTQANAVYTPKDAYDAVEMAVNRLIRNRPEFNPRTADPINAIRELRSLLEKLPTQTKRTGETDEFQQFSTVPQLAFVANWVARPTPQDVVLEPSAGIGGLVAFAKNAGAKVVANELSPRRLALLQRLGIADQVLGENAEQINNVLPDSVRPNLVIMNPPFSSTAGRMQGTRDTSNAIRHVEQALARLEPGGRQVMIVGEGMALDRPAFSAWWKKIAGQYDLRANVQVNGAEYAKYGTTWDNQIVVIDKPVGEKTFTGEPVTGRVERVEDLIPLLEEVRNDRPESIGSLEGERRGTAGSPERPAGTIAAGSDQGVDVGRGGGVSGAEQPGVVEPRAAGAGPVRSEQADLGLGERQGAGEERDVGDIGRSERPASELDRVEVSTPSAQTDEKLTDAVFDNYRPRIVVPGTTMPPVEVQESSAMASVNPITPTYRPALPKEIYQPQQGAKEGRISALAVESVVLAGNSHQDFIPVAFTNDERAEFERVNGYPPPDRLRGGFFIGDGTGMGKGRQVMGVILDNWLQGRKKAIWLTEKPPLINDAKRDADDVAGMAKHIFDVSKVKLADPISNQTGIAFVTYATLRSEEKTPTPGQKSKTRVQQLVDWFGRDFDGVIAMDESHNMANNTPMKGKRGMTKPSEQAMAGLDLQRRLPNARIVYLSATGATEIANLGYAERLGLWGPGTPFANKQDFISNVASGGVAAMELVARDMKALGKYVARSISWREVSYDTLSHPLTPDQREIYDTLAEAWQGVLAEMDKALEAIGAVVEDHPHTGAKRTDGAAKSAARSAFWGAHQRFFNQVITSMKMPTVLKASEKHLADGKSVVMQLVNTNEAAQNRAIDARRREAAENGDQADLEDLDMTPRDVLMQMVERSFPVTQREQYTELVDGKPVLKFRVALDSTGTPILNRKAVAMRDALLDKLGSIRVPDGPLELILNHFGNDKVAEVTGRTQRVVWGKDADGNRTKVIEKRSKLHGIKEANEFQDGKRRVLVFSNAGGTGRSYHADLRAKNQQKRVHILVQAGWEATKAVQGFGRSHRNNQKQAPHYSLATSDVVGEKRFMSSIARRLDQLGALTKGQRQTGSQGLFNSRDNLESAEAKAALLWLYRDVLSGRVETISANVLEQEMGLKMRDKDGQVLADLPPITQFLNRLLSLKLGTQNAVFDAFSDRLDRIIERAIANGNLDQGLENITALSTQVGERKVIHTDPRTGAETNYVRLELKQPNERMEFPSGKEFYRNVRSGKIYSAGKSMQSTETDTGRIVDQRQLTGVTRQQWVNQSELAVPERWEKLDRQAAQSIWTNEHGATPETRDETVHFITGTILPVWDRVQIHDDRTLQVMRAQTDDGERMIGMVIRPKDLPTVMSNFGQGSDSNAITAKEAADRMLEQGAMARLSNGWRLKMSRVAGDNRIELIGPSFQNKAELDTAGVFSERIQFQTRYFVPVDRAADVIGKLIEHRPITELSGSPLAAQPLSPEAPKTPSERFKDALPMAMDIASGYRNIRGVSLDDVQQHARIALARASRAYDPTRGEFGPLARTAINNELRGLYRAQADLGAEQSLDVPTATGETAVANLPGTADVRSEVERDEGRRLLNESVGELPERMQGAITGILEGKTLDEIGAELGGISKQAVGRLATEAMRRLRGKLGERGISRASDLLSQAIIPDGKQPKDYKRSSTQVTLSEDAAKPFVDFAKSIPSREIYTDPDDPTVGREDEPHITALYGITEATPNTTAKAVLEATTGNISATVGKLSVFKGEKYDVLKAEIDSPDLYSINAAMRKSVPFESDFPDYTPHLTIAYLKKGQGEKYVGDARFAGMRLNFTKLDFRSKDGSKFGIDLTTVAGNPANVLQRMVDANLKSQETDSAVEELLNLLNTDQITGFQDRAAAEKSGARTIGRPDLSLGAEGPEVMGVDEYRKMAMRPESEADWQRQAEQMLRDDYDGTLRMVLQRSLTERGTLNPAETKAAQMLVAAEMGHPLTAERRQRLQALVWAYRSTGTEAGRSLASRHDPFKTPEERNREFLAKAIFTPPPAVRRKIESEPDRQKKQALLDADQKRIARIEAELAKMGVNFDDILSGGFELRAKGAKLLENEIAGYDVPHQRALKLAQTGSRSAGEIAKATGLTVGEVERVNDQFISSLRDKLRAKVAAGLTLEKIDLQGALLSQKTESGNAETLKAQSVDVEAELDRIIKGMGFVASKDLGKMKVVKRRTEPVRRRPKLFVPPVARSGKPVSPPTAGQVPYPQPAEAPYTGRVLGQPGLPLYQEIMIKRGADIGNVDDVVKIARVAQAAQGGAFDMVYEAWINNILSGPATHVANITGNLASTALDFTLQRGMEALVNLAYRNADAAQLGEFKYIAQGVMPGIQRGLSLAVRAWNAEADFFKQDVLNDQVEMFEHFDKGGGNRPAIPGKLGRVVRMPGRALLFMDAFFKGAIGQMEAGAAAYRVAKAEGLTDAKMGERINRLVSTPASEAWQRAVEKAINLTFQDPILTTEKGGGPLENAVARFNQMRSGSHLLGFFFPFIRTPWNIFKVGLRKSPLGTANVFSKFARAGFYRIKDGKPVFDSYTQATQVRDLAEQVIAWATFAALWAAITGDDDDDKKRLLITGSTPYGVMKQGERELHQRAYGGSYQIRLGGRNGTYFNYGRYEPIATVLGTVVDTITTLKRLKHGATLGQTMDSLHGYFLAQAQSKTFLQGFTNLSDATSPGEAGGGSVGKSVFETARRTLFEALVPNLIRQPLRNLDEWVRDRRTAPASYIMAPVGALAQPKIDVYGNRVEKGENAISRLFFAAGTKPYPELQKADALLLRWNQRNPSQTFAPVLPAATYKDAQGKNVQMTGEEARKFYEKAGHRAAQMLRTQITQRQVDNPKEEDVKTIRNVFEEAHAQIKREMFPVRAGRAISAPPRKRVSVISQLQEAA
jgi:RNA polymerase sigma factor (sigma-70 family)